MRFDLIDWLLLILVSAIVAATGRLVMGLLKALDRTSFLPLLAMVVILFFLSLYATWLVLRHCIDGLQLGRWLGANALGAVLAVVLMVASRALPGGELLSNPPRQGALGPVGVFFSWLSIFAFYVAYFCPPGLLLQRLSGTNAWPFIIAGALSGLISMLIDSPPLALGGLGLMWGAATGLVQGGIVGLCLGAGLFLMARRGATTRMG